MDGASVVVTGGAGFIGSHLVDTLLRNRRPHKVTVLDDLENGTTANLAHWTDDDRFELVVGDVCDRAEVDRVVAGADTVFHLACLGVRHSLHAPMRNHQVNAEGSLVVGLAARDAGVSRYVHVSSSEAFGTAQYVPMDERHPTWPETVYGAGKLAGEAYARAMFRTDGMATVVARPFNTYGPRSHFEGDSGEVIPRTIVRMLNGQRPVVYGDGSQTRDFMHVSDTATALLALAECEDAIGETVNIGTGVEISMLELCRVIAEIIGRPELTPRLLDPRPGDVLRLCVDNTRMRQLTGVEPTVPFRDGIADLIAWFRRADASPDAMLAQVADTNWNRTGVSA
ncbi:epimerase [Tersicoccus phoenicis]|uniref:Epimerase n=1 Tax=Tersicoccus phoenicis TaxID=554083 RepID=A0A1R1L8I3_9MICC|nr:GDP-mannose 4,6-dehydratase [Tersicoccus phoenicis]OMH23852.1 epimerase [Tersicoccus phoenicis]